MVAAILLISLIFLASYAFFTIYLVKGWRKMPPFNAEGPEPEVFISLVLPFRNEADNLPAFVQSIERQSYNRRKFELIVVDDHSEDLGPAYLKSLGDKVSFSLSIVSLEADKKSKKEALMAGIVAAKGKLILTSDADTTFGPFHLQRIASYYELTKASMIIAPVKLSDPKRLLGQFQALDFLSLQLVTAAYCNQGNPILCNGANLAFEKDAFMELKAFEDNINIASGDDYFLLMKMRQNKKYAISFLSNPDAIALTKTEGSLTSFIQQRIRWAGKTKHAGNLSLYVTGLLNTLFSCWIIALPFVEYHSPYFPAISVLLLIYKSSTDFALLRMAGQKFGIRIHPLYFLGSFVLYPFYICLTFTTSLVVKPYWKGRKIN